MNYLTFWVVGFLIACSGSDRVTTPSVDGGEADSAVDASPTSMVSVCNFVDEGLRLERGPAVAAQLVNTALKVTVQSTARADVQAAVQKVLDAGGGTIYFPAGTYEISLAQLRERTDLFFENLDKLKLYGDGESTILQIENDPAIVGTGVKFIRVQNVGELEIHSMKLVGARRFYSAPGTPDIGENGYWEERKETDPVNYRIHNLKEQQNLIYLRDIPTSTYIHDVTFRDAGGDGINMARVNYVVVSDSDFDDLARNGITIGGTRGPDQSRHIRFENNIFGPGIDTQQIDIELHGMRPFEPDPAFLNENVQVLNNQFLAQVPVDTIDGDQYSMTITETNKVEFRDNQMNNPLFIQDATNVWVERNSIIRNLRILRHSSVMASNNEFQLGPIVRRRMQAGIDIDEAAGLYPQLIAFAANTIVSNEVTDPIRIKDGLAIHIQDNSLSINGATQIVDILARTSDVQIFESGNGLVDGDLMSRQRDGNSIVVSHEKTLFCESL